MTLEFTVGINIAGERRTVTVSAEDALIAALKVKQKTASDDQLRAAQQQTRGSAPSPRVGCCGRLRFTALEQHPAGGRSKAEASLTRPLTDNAPVDVVSDEFEKRADRDTYHYACDRQDCAAEDEA